MCPKRSLLADFNQVEDAERTGQLEVGNPFWDVAFDFKIEKAAA